MNEAATTTTNGLHARLEAALVAAFQPLRLSVTNDSDHHKGPKGRETHFNVVIVGEAFHNQSLVARHRMIYAAVGKELADGVHALQLLALTPAEWEARGGSLTNPAPLCRGG